MKISLLLLFAVLGCLFVVGESQTASAQDCVQFIYHNGNPVDAVNVPCPEESNPLPPNPEGDDDYDGVSNPFDNCPNHHNPDQADTWGDTRGNACDTSGLVNNNEGMVVFYDREGNAWDVYADCYNDPQGQTRCHHLGRLDYCSLPTTTGEGVYIPNPSEGLTDHRAFVTTIGTGNAGVRYYEVRIHDANGVDVQRSVVVEIPGQLCLGPDTDTDAFNDAADYCPGVNGKVHGCPDLASYWAYVNVAFRHNFNADTVAAHLDPNGDSDGDGIINRDDPQQFTPYVPPQNNGDNSGCEPGDANFDPLIMVAENGEDCVGNVTLTDYSTTMDEAYCNAIFYWHSACLAWAMGLPHWDDPWGIFNLAGWSFGEACSEVMYESENYDLCSIPLSQYCAAVPSNAFCQ